MARNHPAFSPTCSAVLLGALSTRNKTGVGPCSRVGARAVATHAVPLQFSLVVRLLWPYAPLEEVACRSVHSGLFCAQSECDGRRDFVYIVWRWACCGSAVRCIEDSVMHE